MRMGVEWRKFARDFAIVIIIFYDSSSFQSADFGDVTRETSENQALLKVKISDEQKIGIDRTDPSWEIPESVLYVFNMLIYITSFSDISILKLNFPKTHTELLTFNI